MNSSDRFDALIAAVEQADSAGALFQTTRALATALAKIWPPRGIPLRIRLSPVWCASWGSTTQGRRWRPWRG